MDWARQAAVEMNDLHPIAIAKNVQRMCNRKTTLFAIVLDITSPYEKIRTKTPDPPGKIPAKRRGTGSAERPKNTGQEAQIQLPGKRNVFFGSLSSISITQSGE